jgi:peptidoglycan/xylan/chitin deacetylase (PgdA/CDA1 family)
VFLDRDIKGGGLLPKTLCLTYDDGPGPQTRELGEYLSGEGIRVTFFVVGRHAEGRGPLLRQLTAWGHLVGNHTYSHPGLVALALAGGDVAGELARADAILREYAPGAVRFFRAPYGNWREKQATDSEEDKSTSVVAEVLNWSGRFPDYVGPVNWDISAADYDYWRRGATAEECARAYLEKVERVGRGIVLMHDSSDEEAARANNRALEATRLLVPALKARGYRFVRLDEVPQVGEAVRAGQNVRE